ncbi:succinyl-CoA ligase [Bacteroides reticulotermitis JCM 10512]|uniref:Succinyl-CoA ligase n=1 Tax=Bacteroides reticulotermitis JCM 10512 TaxID=1445607 RepID=W4UT28_9BACE|nr:succinyl-CoA ligase [Bacteroides reticulotermitis JCM 10512]
MSILVNHKTRLVVQGITGRDGAFHAQKMKEYGTQVVAGTSPGKEVLYKTAYLFIIRCMKLSKSTEQIHL